MNTSPPFKTPIRIADQTFEIESRDEIPERNDIQIALTAVVEARTRARPIARRVSNAGRSVERPLVITVSCLCCAGQSIALIVYPFGGRYRIRRHRTSDPHQPWCINNLESGEMNRTQRIFGPPLVLNRPKRISANESIHRSSRAHARYDTFGSYAFRIFADANAASWRIAFARKDMKVTESDFTAALNATVRNLPFGDLPNGFEAARSCGVELCFGTVFWTPEYLRDDEVVPLSVLVAAVGRDHMSRECWAISGRLLRQAVPSLTHDGATTPRRAKYFVVALINDRTVVNIRLFLCHVGRFGATLPKESEIEGALFYHFDATGRMFFKPLRLDDIRNLAAALNLSQETASRIEHRPDAMIPEMDRSVTFAEVTSYRGDPKPDQFPRDYEGNLDKRLANYLNAGTEINVEVWRTGAAGIPRLTEQKDSGLRLRRKRVPDAPNGDTEVVG